MSSCQPGPRAMFSWTLAAALITGCVCLRGVVMMTHGSSQPRVRAFVRSYKNGAADVSAIWEAAQRLGMRFVAVWSEDQRLCSPCMAPASK